MKAGEIQRGEITDENTYVTPAELEAAYCRQDRDKSGHGVQATRRRTSHTVTAMSSTESASSQPPSIHWNGQNRLAGW